MTAGAFNAEPWHAPDGFQPTMIPVVRQSMEIGRMLEGKTVLVVGGGSGVGLSVASMADRNGARVVTASRNVLKRGGKLADSIKHSAF